MTGKIEIKPMGDDFTARIFKVIGGNKVGFAVYEKKGETYEFVGLLAEIGIEKQ
jgi:hypothetical protein